MKKLKSIILTVIFTVFVFSVSAMCYFKPDTGFSYSERRELAAIPEVSASNVFSGKFMDNFETATADQFPFRDHFRRVKALFVEKALMLAENNGVFKADGHLSKLDEKENPYMLDYAANMFKQIVDRYTTDKNANIYFSIVPDKNYFLAEKNGYPSLDYEGFISRMKEKTPFMNYIDIVPLLSLDDYYTTDSHWKQENITDIAEYLAAEMGTDAKSSYTTNTLPNPFYGVYSGQYSLPVEPDSIKYLTNETLNNCVVTYYDTGAPKKGDMYNMKKAEGNDPYEMFLSGSTPLATIENPAAATDKELVIFRDSFGGSLAPLLAQGYKKITVVDIRYMSTSFIGNFVNFENADVLFIYSTTLLNSSTALRP